MLVPSLKLSFSFERGTCRVKGALLRAQKRNAPCRCADEMPTASQAAGRAAAQTEDCYKPSFTLSHTVRDRVPKSKHTAAQIAGCFGYGGAANSLYGQEGTVKPSAVFVRTLSCQHPACENYRNAMPKALAVFDLLLCCSCYDTTQDTMCHKTLAKLLAAQPATAVLLLTVIGDHPAVRLDRCSDSCS